MVADADRTERFRHAPHNAVADGDALNPRADLGDDPSTFSTHQRFAGVVVESEQDVAEVQASGAHGDPHVADFKLLADVCSRRQLEVFKSPLTTSRQVTRRLVGCGKESGALHPPYPLHVELTPAR